jgi:hypothetical protein
MTLQEIKQKTVGITKKEIAIQLDNGCSSFNYSVEKGATSYNNYTRDELLETCLQFNIDPGFKLSQTKERHKFLKQYV